MSTYLILYPFYSLILNAICPTFADGTEKKTSLYHKIACLAFNSIMTNDHVDSGLYKAGLWLITTTIFTQCFMYFMNTVVILLPRYEPNFIFFDLVIQSFTYLTPLRAIFFVLELKKSIPCVVLKFISRMN